MAGLKPTSDVRRAGAPRTGSASRTRQRAAIGRPTAVAGDSTHFLADILPDTVFRYRVWPTPGMDYLSPAVEAMTGYAVADFFADATFFRGLVHPDDRLALDRLMARPTLPKGHSMRLRWLHRDGSIVHIEQRLSPIVERGRLVAVAGVARDVTAEVLAAEALHESEERFRAMVEDLDVLAVALDPGGRITFINSALGRLLGWQPGELVGRDWYEVATPPRELDHCRAENRSWLAGAAAAHRFRALQRTRDGRERTIEWVVAATRDAAGAISGIVRLGDDVTERLSQAADRARSAAALDQMAESVVITDADARIVYVNPAFERVSGYTLAEVLGKNPSVVSSGLQDLSFYQAMWARLLSGTTWTGELVNRRKDGSLYTEEASITPVTIDGETVIHYVAVKRDVTRERVAEAKVDAGRRQRLEVARLASQIERRSTPEETAQEIVRAVLSASTGIDHAAILTLEPTGESHVLAMDSRGHPPLVIGEALPRERAQYLAERAATGPWAEAWRPSRNKSAYLRRLTAAGFQATAYAPIYLGDKPIAVLAAATGQAEVATGVVEYLPALAELAAAARRALVPDLERQWELSTRRKDLEWIIEGRAFAPAFQPIVELATGRVVAFEALTRFDNGHRPDEVFDEAVSLGRGLDLEIATLQAAVAAAHALPANAWLSLNASPKLVLAVDRLKPILARAERRIVLEVTERERVDDYAALHAAVDALGPGIRIAADDAGVGVANFAHLVELRPRYIKVDISLVRGIDGDMGRQAMVAALGHFAAATNTRLIAEGVETPGELATLNELGVRLGQGYLLGRPAPASAWTKATTKRAPLGHGAGRA